MDVFKGARKVLMGSASLKALFGEAKKVFVVCDPFIEESGTVKYVTDILTEMGVSYDVYSNIQPDPSVALVAEGIGHLVDSAPDVAVGFGGGSAIDACKAMLFFAKKEGLIGNVQFVAIPTTSGTGSEVTDFSVITAPEQGIKYPIVDESLLPDVAVLDAKLTVTVPKSITAYTGMDVLTHAIEALVSKHATDFSDASAEKAIKLVRDNLLKTYREPGNLEARQAMHHASCLAGVAFNNAGLGLNHGMAHALGGKFHIPHGKANAVLLPYVMGFNAGCYDQLTEHARAYARIARLIHVESSSIRQSALNLIRSVKKFIHELELPATIREMGIDREAFMEALDEMAQAAYRDRCTATNPRACSVEEIRDLFMRAYDGKSVNKFE